MDRVRNEADHASHARNGRVLVMTSVAAERDAVLRGLQGDARFDVLIGGVGSAAAAISTAKALNQADTVYGLVVCAGIAGGFTERAAVGSVVVASEMIAADLGAETPDGFLSVDELGFGSARVAVDAELAAKLVVALQAAGQPVQAGPVLTLSTTTGTAATAQALAARIPGAAAEAMEGYGVGLAAQDRDVPALEFRAISNAVGPRDRAAWRIKDALDALEAACAALREVL
ncbi:futalosine hydrolase [Paenibacillus marinisediminis]